MKTKTCVTCHTPKPLTEFNAQTATPDGYTNKCSCCVREYNRKYYLTHQEGIKNRSIEYRNNNVDKVKKTNANFYQNTRDTQLQHAKDNYQCNKGIYRARAKKWREDNPDRVAANLAKRRASKKRAIPKWANITDIRKLYTEAQQLTESSGIEYQVDHIVPLNSKVVCGLHCEDNLRVITAKENNSKNNKLLEELF